MEKTIDIFCDIIDNYGDVGVVYRLSKELKNKGYTVRIFINKLEEVAKIIKHFNPSLYHQEIKGIEFYDLNDLIVDVGALIIIEAFGTELPEAYLNKIDNSSKLLINLEYLSAEAWAEDVHLNKSISPKSWMEKYFYMPGFSEKSGGIIVDEAYLLLVENIKKNRQKYFNEFYKEYDVIYDVNTFYINIFTYHWDFIAFLDKLRNVNKNFIFFILDNRFGSIDNIPENCKIYNLPFVCQEDFDIYINLSDFNFVRGEESFVRAILAEKPFLWNIYPQDEDYHMEKLEAFLVNFGEFDAISNSFANLNRNFNKHLDFSSDFLELIKDQPLIFSEYKENLVKNCNLVTKLLNFIDSKLKNLGGY